MDRIGILPTWLGIALATFFTAGCIGVPNPTPVPTVWDKLGIPQTTARLRDATLNRRGNFPNLEKKPPLLRLADPANLAEGKPEMIKAAAKIKQEKDMKKQKIKAIKFLAEENCGCYDKDGAIAKAFLAALDDCDPDVRKAAIEGLCTAAGNCAKCRNKCAPTCCTEDIVKKVQDIAYGCDDKGCPKEPVKEIRTLAAGLLKACKCPTPNPIEEIPAPPAEELEEIIATEAPREEGRTKSSRQEGRSEGDRTNGARSEEDSSEDKKSSNGDSASASHGTVKLTRTTYRVRDGVLSGHAPVYVASATKAKANSDSTTSKLEPPAYQGSRYTITNPRELIAGRVVHGRTALGELLVELPEVYQISTGWNVVVVDSEGEQCMGRVSEASGRRILITVDGPLTDGMHGGGSVRLGRVRD